MIVIILLDERNRVLDLLCRRSAVKEHLAIVDESSVRPGSELSMSEHGEDSRFASSGGTDDGGDFAWEEEETDEQWNSIT
jgi:hypothetical protein